MKKIYLSFLVVILVLVGGYFLLNIEKDSTNQSLDKNLTTYSSAELGIEFSYRPGPTGYVLEEITPVGSDLNLVRTIILKQTVDADREQPLGGEGPATIAINIFKNTKKQWPAVWAEENIQFSNINLKTGTPSEVVVGEANAIRYMADGLYASDNVVVAHGENMYVLSGMFIDADSQLRKDFSPIVESIKFLPQPGQE